MRHRFALLLFIAIPVAAQEAGDSQASIARILQRMDALEQQNRELLQEVCALKQEVEASRGHPTTASSGSSQPEPSLRDRVTVNEHRIAEQAQTKVEASQKFPISLDGMLLFNAFANSATSDYEDASEYGLLSGPNRSGATVRQTLLGLEFQGPALPGGGRVNGSLMMDFWGGSSIPSAGWLRLRRGGVSLDWKNRSIFVGQDKPLISPFQPDSLAEVGIPPLAGAGNLWLWLPQARYEERIHLDASSGFTAQVALMQTGENYANVPAQYSNSLEMARPALETRFAFWHKFDDVRRVEFGSGFHTSSTHVAGVSVPSYIGSLDWHIVPSSKIGFTGTVYTGQNVASLGALGNGFTILQNGTARPVHSSGGWTQLSFPLMERLTLNLFGGIEDDRRAYSAYSIVHDLTYASNVMYHIGPNVVVS
ncbi:MAG: hypothetical protein ACRD4O_08610, partial [Bryobacteraceae bacterium]